MRFGIVRPERDRRPVAGKGFIQPPGFGQRIAKAVVCFVLLRPEADGSPVACYCFNVTSQLLECDPQIGMERCFRRIDRDCPADQVDGQIGASRLVRNDPEQVQRIGVAAVAGQNFAVQLLGFSQAARLMPLHGIGQVLPHQQWGRPLTSLLRFGAALCAIHGRCSCLQNLATSLYLLNRHNMPGRPLRLTE